MFLNCPWCGSTYIEYTTNGIICLNPTCPSNNVKFIFSDNTNEEITKEDEKKT